MTAIVSALHELLGALEEDHRRLSQTLLGAAAPPPADPELAALATELLRLRWREPHASAMALLGDAATDHADAVERHVVWMASSATPALVVLSAPAVEAPAFQLAS